MAKRKRLTPPQSGFLESSASGPEVRNGPLGMEPRAGRAPIAQVAGDTAVSAALGELTAELERARAEGRLALHLPLDQIDAGHLVRDRLTVEGSAFEELIGSLRDRGQRTPIEVVDKGQGATPRYGLISGWRRLSALRRLAAEDPAFAQVAAIVRVPESAGDAYISMVEENEVRLGLSYYERARIVVKALEEGVFPDGPRALRALFQNVSYAKRSKIGTFMKVVDELDGALRFPTAIGERFGLALARRLERPETAAALRAALAAAPAESADAEFDLISAVLEGPLPGTVPDALPDPLPETAPRRAMARGAVTVALAGDRLTLTGPGVDAELRTALDAWLRRRGHPAG